MEEDKDDEDDTFGFLGQSDGRSCSSTALRPGPVIQNCSGTDIQLARSAVSVASVTKEKGRYLLILPGLMSLKSQPQTISSTTTTSSSFEANGRFSSDHNNNNSVDSHSHCL